KNHAQGEMALPSLGPIQAPYLHKEAPPSPAPPPQPDPSAMERILGPAPPLPPAGVVSRRGPPPPPAPRPRPHPPRQRPSPRRLAGPAFARSSKDEAMPPPTMAAPGPEMVGYMGTHPPVAGASDSADATQSLNGYLRPTVTPAVAASVLPTRRFLLAKGAFIDCTLETAIDSTLPGMTTCITATDTFSADGTVVLLERGTKLVGETRGQVQQGMARIFVL